MKNTTPEHQNSLMRRTFSFLNQQIEEVRQGGLPVLLRKVRSFLGMVLPIPLAVIVLIIVRALRPFVLVRFGLLPSSRIGHYTSNVELYLCRRDAGMENQRAVDIFYYNGPVCNQQLKKMWDRTLRVSRLAGSVARLNSWLPGGEKHVIHYSDNDRDIYGLLARIQPHLSLTPQEERWGHEALEKLGIPDGAPFVCFCARDSAYLSTMSPHRDWTYHDYRDASIHSYIPATEELVRRGYFAIRTGSIVKEALSTTNPMIIDYATKSRTDFLDIYLCTKCQFFLCDTAGISGVAIIFRRPVAIVNYIPLGLAHNWSPGTLFIPKKLWLPEGRRFLSFREILSSEVGMLQRSDQYEQLGIEVLENTPDEITALAIEMDERLKGTWQTTEEDEELQRRFWLLFKPSELNRVFLSRIGAVFLRQNKELLD